MQEYIVTEKTAKSSRIFGDLMIMMIAPLVIAVCFYGLNAVYVTAVSVLSAVICDAAASAAVHKRFRMKDMSALFTGAAIAMMMPANIPLYVPAIASAFAVLAVKIPLGGGLRTPFVPAAAGFAFVCVCFKDLVFTYSADATEKFLGSASVGSFLAKGSSVHLTAVNLFDIICGNAAGPMGTGCILVMLGCAVFLFFRRRNALWATLGFIGVCAIFAFLFPRVNASGLTSLVLELSSGSLMFAAVFLVTDYATLPEYDLFKLIYGAVCGLICMFMRRLGAYEEPVCFAVLLANGAGQLFGYITNKKGKGAAEK